jgi:SMC interacting uncharacterized protein involved in chromosome segregation
MDEIQTRRSRTPQRGPRSNNIVNYSQAINELQNKNNQLRNELIRARSNTPQRQQYDPNQARKQRLMQEMERLQRENNNLYNVVNRR